MKTNTKIKIKRSNSSTRCRALSVNEISMSSRLIRVHAEDNQFLVRLKSDSAKFVKVDRLPILPLAKYVTHALVPASMNWG